MSAKSLERKRKSYGIGGGDGGEYGATTGRPRRVGWFDAVATRYGCRIQGTTEAAFTVLDVLGYLDEIPVCIGYEIDGEVTREFPTTAKLEKAKPVFTRLPAGNATSAVLKLRRASRKLPQVY